MAARPDVIVQYEDREPFLRKLTAAGLVSHADEIKAAIADLTLDTCGAHLAALNMAWCKAARAFEGLPKPKQA